MEILPVEKLILLPDEKYMEYINELAKHEGSSAVTKIMRECSYAAALAREPAGKMTYEQAEKALVWQCSYGRLPRILRMFENNELAYEDCLRLLGENWSGFDNVSEYRRELHYWLTLYGSGHNIPEMMTDDERAALAALPKIVTVYRGCGQKNRNGICWTLDKDIAAGFPFLNRYEAKNPVLITARIRRERIIALKLDREEQEVICFNPKRIAVENIVAVEAA